MTILIEGTIPTTRDPIFRTTGDEFKTDVLDYTKIDIDRITMFNTILTQQTVILYIKRRFGEFRKLRQFVLKLDESAEYLVAGEFLPLEAGDDIEAETTTADAVDVVVHGRRL